MRVRISRSAVMLTAGVIIVGIVGVWRNGEGMAVLWIRLLPWLIVMAAALLHELGHIVIARCVGVGIRGMKLDLFGARLELGGLLSYGQECLIAAGGPLVNFLSAAFLYPIPVFRGTGEGALFLGVSITLGCVNLLPVWTLDGGRILRGVVAWFGGDRVANRTLRATTGLCLGFLWILAVYALLREGQMLSLFAFSLCLLARSIAGKDGV